MRPRIIPTLILLFLPWPPALGGPVSTGKWLVDLGRDYPLLPQSSVTDTDAEITLLFMQAASRVEPQLAEAYLWTYDMLSALGREADARKALAEYLARQPDDVAAHLNNIESTARSLQTAEERAQLYLAYLKRPDLPGPVSSDLHRRLAEFYWNRGDNERAEAEALTALREYEQNLAAGEMLDQIRHAPDTAAGRIERLLGVMRVSPANAAVARQLGDELSALRMPREADRWYRHAIRMHELAANQPPDDLLVARSGALLDSGQIEEARVQAEKALEREIGNIPARLVLARIAGRRGDSAGAREQLANATESWKNTLSSAGGRLDGRIMAEMAWHLALYGPLPAEAEAVARSALTEDPTSTVALRALGSSLRRKDQFKEAIEALEPIAGRDVWAAIELARALQASGRAEEAGVRLRSAGTQPAIGEQREAITQLATEWKLPAPQTQPAAQPIKVMLDAFPVEILNYPEHPDRYLSLELSVPAAEIPPAEPWLCTVRLKNTGPFPIVFGPDGMLVPELLCSIQTIGDDKRGSGPTIRILLNGRMQLKPGATMETTQTIDIGPIRSSMIGTPQVTHDVEVTAALSPVRLLSAEGQEMWAPGVGGLLAKPLKFQRVAITAMPDEVRKLIARSSNGQLDERITALELLAMLLAEHQHIAGGRLNYSTHRIDAEAVQAAILDRAGDPDWQVRARLAECMRWFLLDKTATQVSTRLLADRHWLVRGLTLRMLADQYRKKPQTVLPVLKRFAAADPDEWVRAMGTALSVRLNTTTRPADAANAAAAGPVTVAPTSRPADALQERKNTAVAAPSKEPRPIIVLPDEPPRGTAPSR